MKIVFGILVLFFFSKECNQQQTQTSNLVQEDMTITYEASTRGFYEKTWITKDSVSFSNDRTLKEVFVSSCKNEDWEALVSLMKDIDIKTLSQLVAPSKMHQVDGAAMATFLVEMNNETYETNIFDHGHPPKSISVLVKKVLSIKEKMSKH